MGVRQTAATYDDLKRIATEQISWTKLEQLKESFSGDIGSVRRKTFISSISDLLGELERLDVLSEYNVEPLLVVADICGLQRLHAALGEYEPPANVFPQERVNQYRVLRLEEERLGRLANISYAASVQKLATSTKVPLTAPSPRFTVTFAYSAEKHADVRKLLSRQIGAHWRRLGRELDVTEAAMDEIELQFPRDLSSRVYKLLQVFEESGPAEPEELIRELCRALDQSSRKDLRRKVERLFQ